MIILVRCYVFQVATNLQCVLFVRKLEHDVETVIRVLQPGPVGIVEHKFTNEEIRKASTVVRSAVENWRIRAKQEKSGILRDYIEL